MKRAVFPGSFDPVTLGHMDIITRGLELFDELIIAIGVNADKKYMFSLDERKTFLEQVFEGKSKIKIKTYSGLTAQFCKQENAAFILRGLRNTQDLIYEQSIAQTNYRMAEIESIFLVCSPKVSHISSTIVRDVMRHGGDYSELVPESVRIT